jgi:3',5'-cyclic AMP phosphodiesterase CpdA
MLIAQFSDTHIKPAGQLAYSVVDTHLMLSQAIDHVLQLPQQPDVMIISGDLVDAGSVVEYERLSELLARLPMPVLLVPGNHDDRDNMRIVFRDHPGITGDGFWQFALKYEQWPVRIVGLDTVISGGSAGTLCEDRLAWLESTLTQAPDTPTLLVMHHPPFITGIGHMDDIGLDGRHAFERLIEQHPQIERIVCGHLHRHIHTLVGGRSTLTCPSTAHTVQLDLARDAAAEFRMEPAGYLLHWWNGEQLITHQVHAVFSDGPYPFFDETGRLML